MSQAMDPSNVAARPRWGRDLILLVLCQGLLLSNNVTFIAVNGLVGLALAPTPWLATLPVTGYVVGGAVSTWIVARSMQRFGRKRAFMLGILVSMAATTLCAYAVSERNFALLVAGTFINGYYNANGALYRFAAVEVAPPSWKERAISLVLAGGLLGGVTGMSIAEWGHELLSVPFAGSYALLVGLALGALLVVSQVRFPPLPAQGQAAGGRPLATIMRQPVFIVAALAAAISYGVMNLLMTSTPIAMAQCRHPFSSAGLVLEWHVIGMFAPSFVTGFLIRRFGVFRILFAGVLLNFACVAVALSGVEVMQFLVSSFLLGVGWNFLYIGGTTLVTSAYRPEERTRTQGALDFCVFGTMGLSSFASGALVTQSGWNWLNLFSLPFLLVAAAGIVYLAIRNRRTALV